MITSYIYGLWDPLAGELRYIGKSIDPERRLVIRNSRAKTGKGDNPVHCWIRKLLVQNERPMLEILEEVTEKTWREIEKDWIKQCRNMGIDLLNVHDGGGGLPPASKTNRKGIPLSREHRKAISLGGHGVKRTKETRRKMSEAKKRLYDDPKERKKQSERMMGHSVSEETREKLRQANLGKKHTKEAKRKVSIAFKGRKLSEEHKKKISEAQKRRWKRERTEKNKCQLSLL